MIFSSLRKDQGGLWFLVLGNFVAIGTTRVGGALIDGFTFILVARYFGPVDYGRYLSLLAFLNLVDATADLTVTDVTVREISKDLDRAGAWLATCTVLRLILAGVGFLAYVIYIYSGRIAQTPGLLAAAWIGSLILPVGALRMPITVFRAEMKMHFELVVTLITRLVNLALFISIMHYHGKLNQFFLATFLSRSLLAVLVWGAAVGWLRVRLSFRSDLFYRLIRESFPMAVAGFFLAVQLKVDILMVASISGAVAAGLYGVVAQLPEYSLLIPAIITTPLFPILSRSLEPALQERFHKVYQNVFDSMMTCVTPIAVVAMVMPRQTVILLFGKRFAEAAGVLPLLVLSMVFLWLSHALSLGALAAGLQRSFIWIQLICVAVYLALNWILIPLWGFWGAAIARLIGAIIAPFLIYLVVKNRIGFILETQVLRRTIFAGLTMAVAVSLFSKYPLWLAGAVGMLVYGATLGAILLAHRRVISSVSNR